MKKLTYYEETNKLLRFIIDNWPDYSVRMIKTILTEAKEKLEEQIESTVTTKNLDLGV